MKSDRVAGKKVKDDDQGHNVANRGPKSLIHPNLAAPVNAVAVARIQPDPHRYVDDDAQDSEGRNPPS